MTSDEIKFDSEVLYQTDCIIYVLVLFFLLNANKMNKQEICRVHHLSCRQSAGCPLKTTDQFQFPGIQFPSLSIKYKIFIPETRNVIEFMLWKTANKGKDVRACVTLDKNCNC